MSDSTGRDRDLHLDGAIARVVADAGRDAPAAPSISAFIGSAAPAAPAFPGARRWAMVGVAVLIVGALAGVVVVASRDDAGRTLPPVDSAPVATDRVLGTLPPTSETVSTNAPTTVEQPSPSTAVTAANELGVTRPVVASSICEPVSARETFTNGLTLFARSSNNPVPIQIIGDPADGPVGPFAIVQRYFGDDRTPNGDETVEVNGATVWIRVYGNGNGAAEWDLGDGSLGYVRSRGLERAELVEMVGALTPRDAGAEIPGFDFTDVTGARVLLHEQLNTDVDGEVGRSECDVATTGYRYRISAISGDPVFQYGGVIDRPVPLVVGMREDILIVIDGVDDASAPDVSDVIDADPADWLELRSRPQWLEGSDPLSDPRTEPISEDTEVVVALESVDGSTASSFLTFRLTTQQGVTNLEVHTANAVLAPDAAFWRTDLDGAERSGGGMSTASVGPVFGFPVGVAPLTEPFDVTVSIIDGGEFVLQTTGTITLMPS